MGDPLGSDQYDLGVLFVHGIGNQTRGSTLVDFGTPLIEWIRAREDRAGADVTFGTTLLSDSGDEPASAELSIGPKTKSSNDEPRRRWLMAESWWAESFPVAQFRDIAVWGLLIVPWTIGTHFALRWARTRSNGLISGARAIATLACALFFLSPLVMAAMALLLALGKIPWPQLQSAIARIQRALASSLGDSYMLVQRPVEAAAIRSRLQCNLDWIVARCKKTAVIAHSQGAALACQVLRTGESRGHLLITFGSGLRKLEELDAARRDRVLFKGALISSAGIFVGGLALVFAPLVAYRAFTGELSVYGVAAWAVFAAVGILVGIAGTQDFINARDPVALNQTAALLSFKEIEWKDVYASADPVPNGPLHNRDAPPHSIEVVNLRSIIHDHTSYWTNRDGFVALVADSLLKFERPGSATPPAEKAVSSFLRAQRSIRIGMRQALSWVTLAAVASLIVTYRSEWLTVAAWVGHRMLVWAERFVPYESPPMSIPDVAVWRRSVGWLCVVLLMSWTTQRLWYLWNSTAMEDAQRGTYGVREPFAVLVSLFLQLLVSAIAVVSYPYAFATAAVGMLLVLIPVVVAQGRHPVPKELKSIATKEPSSSPETVLRALATLFAVGITIFVVPVAWFRGALRFQAFLAAFVGAPVSWAGAVAIMIVGAVLIFAAASGILATLSKEE